MYLLSFRLNKLNAADEERRNRESTLNALESFVFEAQNRLDSEEYVSALSPDEQGKISDAVTKVIIRFDKYTFVKFNDLLLT